MNENKSQLKNNLIGAGFVLFTTLCFTSGLTIIKHVTTSVDSFHIIFWKSLVGMMVVLISGLVRKKLKGSLSNLNKEQKRWIIFRGIIGTIVVFAYFTALAYGGLGELGSIVNLNPVITVFLAFFILKESLNKKVILAVVIAITGVFFIVGNPFTIGFSWAYPLIIVTTVFISLETISIRKLNLIGIDIWIIVGSFLFVSLIITTPKIIIDGIDYQTDVFIYMMLVGLIDTSGHLSLSTAGRYLPAKIMSILTLATVFEFMIFGYIFFDEEINEYKIIGGILIIIASSIAIIINARRRKKTSQTNKDVII
jgi:drug/metabolite transporter (DMT)-like permease